MKNFSFIKKIAYGAGLLPFVALAQTTNIGGGYQTPTNIVTTYNDVPNLINGAANWILGILLAAAVIFILIAAFNYLTSAGDEKKTAAAKKMVTYAIIAIALGLLARGVIALVLTFFGQPTTAGQ